LALRERNSPTSMSGGDIARKKPKSKELGMEGKGGTDLRRHSVCRGNRAAALQDRRANVQKGKSPWEKKGGTQCDGRSQGVN